MHAISSLLSRTHRKKSSAIQQEACFSRCRFRNKGRILLSLREFRRPIFTGPNFDGNTFPKRAQWKTKLHKMMLNICQKVGQMRTPIGPKCARGVPGELWRTQVTKRRNLIYIYIYIHIYIYIYTYIYWFIRLWVASWLPLDLKGIAGKG